MVDLYDSSVWLICTGIRIVFLVEQFHPLLLINSVKMTGSSLENKNNILFFSHLHTFIYIIYIIIIIIFIYKIKIKRKCKNEVYQFYFVQKNKNQRKLKNQK